ncbi:protein containing Signal transduction response regulator, receiver region domain protein [Rhodopirellula baltica SWK14]|uniref:Protein containing Signal transduction response regulator, receiver region domain protein n=1 Tax=Rhodopirellula baltica SWK14 TaxID=993516 RepID=L7CLJ9_RHOBT|nr:protein containing Signal transduction response regulator, receiver region domain protein [Rhodopirellula baltica SWK14]
MPQNQLDCVPHETQRAILRQLQSISLSLHLFKHQTELNLTEDAERTFQSIRNALSILDEHGLLQSCENECVVDERTILLVEDDANERALLASYLRLQGYNIACAGDGDMALRYLSEHDAPRFILLDMNMPQRDGVSTLTEIRKDERFCDITVFAISGSTAEENGLADDSGQIDQWFMKPLCVDNLVSALKLAV